MNDRSRKPTRDRDRSQSRGRRRTRYRREGLDDLDALELFDLSPGVEQASCDTEWGDDVGDDSTIDGDPADAINFRDAEASSATTEDGYTDLKSIIGTRPPVVAVRLTHSNGQVIAHLVTPPNVGARAKESLKVIHAFVEGVFNTGYSNLDNEAWEQLIGDKPASAMQRRTLLAGLHAEPNSEVKRDARALYGKFAELPDGTAFSINLLLPSQQGKRRDRSPGRKAFDLISEEVKRQTFRDVLDREAAGELRDANGKAMKDRRLMQEWLRYLQSQKLLSAAPQPEEWVIIARRWRERCKKKGWSDLAENGPARNKRYHKANNLGDENKEPSGE